MEDVGIVGAGAVDGVLATVAGGEDEDGGEFDWVPWLDGTSFFSPSSFSFVILFSWHSWIREAKTLISPKWRFRS